jgi:hypothetical protein
MFPKLYMFISETRRLYFGVTLLLSVGSIFGLVIDRTSGRALSNFEFFKKGLTPDGLHYSVQTLRILDFSDIEIIKLLKSQYNGTGIKISEYFLNPAPWETALVDPRVFYSILSVPFVKLFGTNGMFTVPIISFMLLTILPLVFTSYLSKNKLYFLAFFISTIFLTSFYVKYNVLANTTDGLSTLLIVALVLYLYLIQNRYNSRFTSLGIASVCLMVCITRQNEIYVLGILVIFLISSVKNSFKRNFVIVIVASLTIITWLVYSFNEFGNYRIITSSDGTSLSSRNLLITLGDLAVNFPKTIFIELSQLWLRDQGVFLVIVTAMFLLAYNKRIDFLGLSFLWCFLAGMSLTTVNGGLGSGFRYALPAIFLGAIVILTSASEIMEKERNKSAKA